MVSADEKDGASHPVVMDAILIVFVDRMLERYDSNADGYVDFYEYLFGLKAQRES